MDNQNIIFKGTKNGVIMMVKGHSDYQFVKQAIAKKMDIAENFFSNGKLYIDFSKADLDQDIQASIKKKVQDDFNICIQQIDTTKEKVFSGTREGKTKFLRSTIRSGQWVEYFGNIVIIGDVNAGAQVVAGGNIIVLGALRGVVHAGASGNDKAVIAAFSLQPTQLRIADFISRAPDGENIKPKCPELAKVKDGYIVIEPYLPDKYI